MTDTQELKPCPFCGEGQKLHVDQWRAVCLTCGAKGPPANPENTPECSWNSRATPPEVQALVRQSEITELNLLRLASDAARIDDLQQQLAFLANELGQALAAFEKKNQNDSDLRDETTQEVGV